MNCFNKKKKDYSYSELSINKTGFKSRIGCLLKWNVGFTVINLIILIVFIVILVFKIIPYASKIGDLDFSEISDTIDQIHSILNSTGVNKVSELVEDIDVDSIESYASKFQKIIDWGCSELPVNCSS